MKNFDKAAINESGIASLVLMENAGKGSADYLVENLHDELLQGTAILCGS